MWSQLPYVDLCLQLMRCRLPGRCRPQGRPEGPLALLLIAIATDCTTANCTTGDCNIGDRHYKWLVIASLIILLVISHFLHWSYYLFYMAILMILKFIFKLHKITNLASAAKDVKRWKWIYCIAQFSHDWSVLGDQYETDFSILLVWKYSIHIFQEWKYSFCILQVYSNCFCILQVWECSFEFH